MNTRQSVANRLMKLCDERRLALNALANLSAVPPSTLKSIINGDSRNPGIVTIKLLCDYVKGWASHCMIFLTIIPLRSPILRTFKNAVFKERYYRRISGGLPSRVRIVFL